MKKKPLKSYKKTRRKSIVFTLNFGALDRIDGLGED
jgi:hypothetical protein